MKKKQKGLTYKGTGVDYDSMDPFKLIAQLAAAKTAENIKRFGFKEITASRGESVYIIETPFGFLAHVEEGLGTKNLVADAMYRITGRTYYDKIAQCTLAMIVNDMITLGAWPVSIAMHLAVAESTWFDDLNRSNALVEGWKKACDLARCTWGGGETPTLKGIVVPGTSLLSGSGIGFTKKLINPKSVKVGDAIILLESSGIHANGLTLARNIADRLTAENEGMREGYLTTLSDGSHYGDALLTPTHIYVGAVEDLMQKGINIHYAVNITGHGLRKLMRLEKPFTYRIKTLPPSLPIFEFIQKHGPVSDEEAYGNLNMGAGFAIYVSKNDAERTVNFINKKNYGFKAINAGIIEKGPKQVIIEPKNLVYKGETLGVR